jgi:hypothetical protein
MISFIISTFHFIKVREVGHSSLIEDVRSIYKLVVGRPEGKRTLGRCKHRKKDNA